MVGGRFQKGIGRVRAGIRKPEGLHRISELLLCSQALSKEGIITSEKAEGTERGFPERIWKLGSKFAVGLS